uniref:Putative transcriptional regulator n=1 Tax=Eubacterium cellulosolvens (strain ATCC 43171 / JCM 9499 / 6) TaxID=633697 RepID=I5AUD4_EUBC6
MGNGVFASRIRKLRMDRGLTMERLSKDVKVSRSAVAMWESNGTVPRDDLLIKLSKYFGVSIDYLLGNEKMEDKGPESERLQYIQRSLGKLDETRLEKAEQMLSVMFDDIFDDEEGTDDI